MSESQPHDDFVPIIVVFVSAVVLLAIYPMVCAIIIKAILPWIQKLKERRRRDPSARNGGDDVEMQDTSPATHAQSTRARQFYDSARDGFVPTPVYGGSTRSLVSYGGFADADMEDLVSPKTIPATQAFVYAGGRAEGDRERSERLVKCFIGEEEPESPAREDELEGVKRNIEKVVSPYGLGISGRLDAGESDIQAQLEMLEGRLSAEDVWSCEVVETFEGV